MASSNASDESSSSNSQQQAQAEPAKQLPGSGDGGGNGQNAQVSSAAKPSQEPAPAATQSPPASPARAMGQPATQVIPIETKFGLVRAHVQGDLEQVENRGVFLTVHDIGSNSRSFLEFTEHPIMIAVKMRSLFIHIDLMGQQDNQQR